MYQVWALSFTGCFLGLVHASPAYLQTSSNFLIPRNGTDPIKAVCPFPLDDMNPATAQAAWANSGADAYLEKFLEPQNELNWYQNLWAKIHHGDNVAYPCQDVLGTCAIVPTDCETFVKHYRDDAPVYWILKAINTVHDYFSAMMRDLDGEVLQQLISADQLIADFTEPSPSSFNVWGVLAAALTFGAGLGVGSNVAAGSLTASAGLMSGLALSPPSGVVDPSSDVYTQLGAAFNAFNSTLDNTNTLAIDGRNSGSDSGDVNQLPSQTGSDQMATARFYADGKWLVEDLNTIVGPTLPIMKKTIQDSLVIAALNANELFVWIDKSISEEDCEATGVGYAWTSEGCASLFEWVNGAPLCNEGWTSWYASYLVNGPADSNFLNNMINDVYQMPWADTWQHAIDCAKAGGSLDPSTFQAGQVAPCVYNLGVIEGSTNGKSEIQVCDGCINTFPDPCKS